MKRILGLMLAFAMLICMVSGCSSSDPGSAGTPAPSGSENTGTQNNGENSENTDSDALVIGYCFSDLNNMFESVICDYVEQWADEHPEVQVLVGNGDNDASTQMAVVEGWIQMGVDCICVKPSDYEASIAIMKSVQDAGIYYIPIEQDIDGSDCFVGSNEVANGRSQMEATLAAMSGPGNVAYLAGTEGTLVASDREEGSMEVLNAAEGYELIAREDADWKRDNAISIVETWITSGLQIDAICASCDEMAVGAILALQDAGIEGVVVTGIDGLETGLEQVEAGWLTATLYVDAESMARKALDAAVALCKGENPEKCYLEAIWITKENVDEYLALWRS